VCAFKCNHKLYTFSWSLWGKNVTVASQTFILSVFLSQMLLTKLNFYWTHTDRYTGICILWCGLSWKTEDKRRKRVRVMKRDDRVDHSLCFFFLRRSEISVFASKNLTSFRLLKSRADKTLEVFVCVWGWQRDRLFFAICLSVFWQRVIGDLCWTGLCFWRVMYVFTSSSSPRGRTPSYVSVPVLYLYKYRLGGAFY